MLKKEETQGAEEAAIMPYKHNLYIYHSPQKDQYNCNARYHCQSHRARGA